MSDRFYERVILFFSVVIAVLWENILHIFWSSLFKEAVIAAQFFVVYAPPYILYKILLVNYRVHK